MTFKFLALIMSFILTLSNAQELPLRYKDQKQSVTKWGKVKLDTFFSFKDWKDDVREKERVPDWEVIVRERTNKEIVGRFFQCVGRCRIDRGEGFFNPSFRSSIFEGDEVQTTGESYAWIFLFDGTMVRMSPNSSITFNEINIGIKENFLNARINSGNVLWLSRSDSFFEENNLKETDSLFFPLSLYEAQPISDKKKYSEDNLFELLEEKNTVLNHYKYLNQLIEENNKMVRAKKTFAFLVMPNITLMGYSPSVEVVSLLGGKTYLKRRTSKILGLKKEEADEPTSYQLRGFENKTMANLESDKWFVVDDKGRTLLEDDQYQTLMGAGELITKRIPSLMVARELLLKQYSEFCFREKYNPLELAANDGYRLWGNLQTGNGEKIEDKDKSDLDQRLEFISEYTRRIETSNLLVSSQFKQRLETRGEKLKEMTYDSSFFSKAMRAYLDFLSYPGEKDSDEVLNSTTKIIWKRMHGSR